MGGSSAPKADPNIGLAALKSAQTGEQMLTWMQDQAKITNEWAAEDRGRWNDVFKPLQDQYIAEAKNWDSEGRKTSRANQAIADTQQRIAAADGTRVRQAMAMGINPASGRFGSSARKSALDAGLATVGAANVTRRQVEQEAEAKKANAINLGSGLAVNPATSMGISNGAIQAGGSAAMQGYGQQGSLLNAQYEQQLQSWQANQNSIAGVASGIGSLAGLAWGSSKRIKTDKRPVPEGVALGAIRKMPVEEWTYKPGVEDGGRHIGPYAEDFHRATGKGDGKSIPAQDVVGLALGAIRDLDRKIDRLGAGRDPKRRAA